MVLPLSLAVGQESDPFAPAQGLDDGWQQMDQRLMFLMVRLVDVEANLEAIDKASGKSRGRAAVAASQANRARAGNDRMDRNAGGPVRWDKFYGTTAEKFFYHPTDNHTYHTQTVLQQRSPGTKSGAGTVDASQGVPVSQRPPQFDYMYRANENARQRATANVAKFKGNAQALAKRRHELQLEQSKLWCEVAFRAVAKNDLNRKALYCFAPSDEDQNDLLAAAKFVTTALHIVDNGQKDQGSTFRQVKELITKARYELGGTWLRLGVKYRDESSEEWKFASLARRLEDVSANLADSYSISIERQSAGDAARRDLYRGLLQKALIQYAETVLALDEMATEMAKERDFKPNLDQPIATPKPPPSNSPEKPSTMVDFADAAKPTEKTLSDSPNWIDLFDRKTLSGWAETARNRFVVQNGLLVCLPQVPGSRERGYLFHREVDGGLHNFELVAEVLVETPANSGIYFHTRFQRSGHPRQGIEVQIDSGIDRKYFTGSLFGLRAVTYDPIKSGEWVTIKLVVNGARVMVLINDEEVLNYVEARGQRPASPDAERLIRNGTIAIQGTGGSGRVFFKSIRIRKLPPA